ncbi:MAG: delta-60 repeat domain-containing protein [Opitutaceae bacterium]
MRFTSSGEIDDTFRVALPDGTALAIDAAGAAGDGASVWASSWLGGVQSLHLLGTDGQPVRSFPLQLSRDGRTTISLSAVVGVPGGAVIGGGFDAVNRVRAPGVARIDADGNVDTTWGGWFVEGTLASSIVRAGNGLMHVAGSLRTPTGTAATTLLRADGLPEFNAPQAVTPGTRVAPLAPAGDWLAHLAPNETGVRRWQVSPAPDVPLVVPDQPVGVGESGDRSRGTGDRAE